jgi:hypothetical protein
MAGIAELQMGQNVTAVMGILERRREGVISGQRVDNRIEGDMGFLSDGQRQPDEGPDMVRVSFPPRRPGMFGSVTTHFTCFPESVEIV